MATLDEARRAKECVKTLLGKPAWLRGIGIGSDSGGAFVVQVSVSELSDEVKRLVPSECEGVPVRVDTAGSARALAMSRSV